MPGQPEVGGQGLRQTAELPATPGIEDQGGLVLACGAEQRGPLLAPGSLGRKGVQVGGASLTAWSPCLPAACCSPPAGLARVCGRLLSASGWHRADNKGGWTRLRGSPLPSGPHVVSIPGQKAEGWRSPGCPLCQGDPPCGLPGGWRLWRQGPCPTLVLRLKAARAVLSWHLTVCGARTAGWGLSRMLTPGGGERKAVVLWESDLCEGAEEGAGLPVGATRLCSVGSPWLSGLWAPESGPAGFLRLSTLHVLPWMIPQGAGGGVVADTAGRRAAALASTHQMPVAPPASGRGCLQCPQTLPHVPGGQNCPWLRTTELEGDRLHG